MTPARVAVFLALAIILGIPFALRPAAQGVGAGTGGAGDAETLVVITPHVQQIRYEFERGFDRWHQARTGRRVRIDWRSPGGTSEILKQLEAQYQAAMRNGAYEVAPGEGGGTVVMAPGTISFDLVFGGGTYDHGRLKRGITVPGGADGGQALQVPMSAPAGFSQAELDEWFGENRIGAQPLYDPGDPAKGDPGQFWIGTALSGFGIVYNRDVLARLGLPEPVSFDDLTDPRYAGWIALADPRQSGSISTTFDSILSNFGWDQGWRILREMCANARYFTNSSATPPIDVSQGEAAAGLAIDFYGRSQGQSVLRPGEDASTGRVGYVDPEGSVYIDADPVSLLRGGPHPELAREFVRFCLSEEGQALWQFRAEDDAAGEAGEGPIGRRAGSPPPIPTEELGPERYELRRMPVRRVMYEKHLPYFVDRANPFELASETKPRGWRGSIGIMMGAFAIDVAEEQRAAWGALNRARGSAGFPRTTLAEMEGLFYGWPEHAMPGGEMLAFNEANYKAIAESWKDPAFRERCEIAYTRAFRERYARIVDLEGHAGPK